MRLFVRETVPLGDCSQEDCPTVRLFVRETVPLGDCSQEDCPTVRLFVRETVPFWDCSSGKLPHCGIVVREDCSTLGFFFGGEEVICIALYCEYISSVFMLGRGIAQW